MSISARIAPHLPYLRRFGRAMSGSQESGDAYVVAVLELLVADPNSFPAGEPPRIVLYRAFLRIWNSVDLNHGPSESSADGDGAGRKLGSITPLPRQAFLLTSVEGFTTQQTAAILGQSPDAVTDLLTQAGQEIAE